MLAVINVLPLNSKFTLLQVPSKIPLSISPLLFFFFFWWYWGLNSGSAALYHLSHTPSPVNWFLTRLLKQFSWESKVSSTNSPVMTRYSYAKGWCWMPSHSFTKTDQRPKLKSWSYKTLRRKNKHKSSWPWMRQQFHHKHKQQKKKTDINWTSSKFKSL
jgi:hypothetical protein